MFKDLRPMMFIKFIFFTIIILNIYTVVFSIENCVNNSFNSNPCITIKKTPNTSEITENGIRKISIGKKEINNSGAIDVKDVLKTLPGLDVFQSGQFGQQTSLFMRGAESNHTLVLLNGVPINDQSVTDGLHDFGQDFIQTFEQVEVYKGSNGANFGPSAISGAVNLISDINYSNSFSINTLGSNDQLKNNSLDANFTKITKEDLYLNFKIAQNKSKTKSSIAKGTEKDGSRNLQFNINVSKWLDDTLKLKSTIYSRNTKSDYDGSATDEKGYVSDNKMYAIQSGIEKKFSKFENDTIFHFHNYDREYENAGYLDEYKSQSLVLKSENRFKPYRKFSFGFGNEFKYDTGEFENRGSYNASTKGHISNLGYFTNIGLKISENQVLSLFNRHDYHNTTGRNQTYKINLTNKFNNLKFGFTQSTGLRNPTLYELYGSDNYGMKGNTGLNPEKSKTDEIFGEYIFQDKIKLLSTIYRTNIFDRIETDTLYSKHENKSTDINQEGIETELILENDRNKFSFFSNFSKSRNEKNQAQSRRPDLSYGANYFQILKSKVIGQFFLNVNYKHTGKYVDWDGSKNSKQKETNLIDLTLKKKIQQNIIFINISNLLDEKYEKPATYSQDGRTLRLGIKKLF